MAAGYFIIALLGCADGSASCTQVATMPTRYSTQAECVASVNAVLSENSSFDFPTIMAECRAVSEPLSLRRDRSLIVPASARRS
ncbi:MAG: hypothetical protein ABIO43_10265 [Sphingomicrobium sp.]